MDPYDDPEPCLRGRYGEPLCPKCGAVVKQCERADWCEACDYEEVYP